MKYVIIGPLIRVIFRPEVKGLRNVPKMGGAIVAGNHLSFLDQFVLALVLPRRITFIAKSDYFNQRGLKGRLMNAFFRAGGQIPVDRAGGAAANPALVAGKRVVTAGGLLGIYPEGTRSPDGRLYKGHTGVAKIALSARVPVIPCSISGTFEAMPPGRVIPRVRKISISFGDPCHFIGTSQADHVTLRQTADAIMVAIGELSDQQYVDRYASEVKSEISA
ncbi:lysophospholipid acyltransferase family protein [Streptomyces sp. NPDC058664]|uniref:lysophospholipid acyltransferase family protein n=1 Tax=unclassified Streptomyces TaxID=2593676 RepID=UPI00364B6352